MMMMMMMKTSCTAWHRKYTTYSLSWVSSCLYISWIVQAAIYITVHDHSAIAYPVTLQRHLSRTADIATSQFWNESLTWDFEKLTTNFALENSSWSSFATESLWRRCSKTQKSLISFSITKKLWMCQIHRGVARCHDWESIEIIDSCDSWFSQSHLFI